MEALPNLDALANRAGLVISEGLQLRRKVGEGYEPLKLRPEEHGRLSRESEAEPKPTQPDEVPEPHPELTGRPILITVGIARLERIFAFPAPAIHLVQEDEVYVRAGFRVPESICRPPHILVSAARNWAVFSNEYLIVPPRQIGIAGDKSTTALLKALALYLNSDFVRYHQFFISPEHGVKRERSTLTTLRKLPIPAALFDRDGKVVGEWSTLYATLATSDHDDQAQLLREVNTLVYKSLDLRPSEMVRVKDFVNVMLGLEDGKVEPRATRMPREKELKCYAQTLKRELDAFIGSDGGASHAVELFQGFDRGAIQIDLACRNGKVVVYPTPIGEISLRLVANLRARLESALSQWRYFNRNLRLVAEDRVYLFKPMQRFHWLQSQAVLDASEVIGMVLDRARGSG